MVVGIGALGQLQLAEDDRPGFPESGDDSRIFAGTILTMDFHARGGRCIAGPAKVLDGDGHAVKRSPHLAASYFLVCDARLLQCRGGHDMRVALQLAIEAGDAIELGLGHLHRGQIALLDAPSNFNEFGVV